MTLCLTFSDIYQSFTAKRLEKYSIAFGDPKLCKLVVKVFGNAKGEPILTSLLSVISILLGLKSNQDLFVKEKLIPSIVSLMRKNATSAQIQLLSCNVLMKFLPYKGNFFVMTLWVKQRIYLILLLLLCERNQIGPND